MKGEAQKMSMRENSSAWWIVNASSEPASQTSSSFVLELSDFIRQLIR